MTESYSYDITEDVVFNLTGRTGGSYTPSGVAWDCTIGGLPFIYATSKERQHVRQTADYRRQRTDQGRDPGENSLDSGLWIRSQSSYHYGAGLKLAEPLEVTAGEARFRYNRAWGVEPFTAGELTSGELGYLRATLGYAVGDTKVSHIVVVDDNTIFASSGRNLTKVHFDGTASSTITWGGSSTILDMTYDGTNVIIGTSTGIYFYNVTTNVSTLTWNTFTATSLSLNWIKNRLIAGIDNKIYELVVPGSSLPYSVATKTPLLATSTLPSGWTWNTSAEGPTAIFIAGYAGYRSAIYKVAVNQDTAVLATPVVVAELPSGEIVKSIKSYLSTYLGIGSNKGARVATIGSDSSLSVGPLLCAGNIHSITMRENFMYAAGTGIETYDGSTTSIGAYKIDLSTDLADGGNRFPHTLAHTFPGVNVGDIAVGNTAIALCTYDTSSAYVYTSAHGIEDKYYNGGVVMLGGIRFDTLENKLWQSVRISGEFSATSYVDILVSADGEGDPLSWKVIGRAQFSGEHDFGLSTAVTLPQPTLYVALKFTSDGATTANVRGLQVRSVPAPKKTRLFAIPLMCFDFETDRNNVLSGETDGAMHRVFALEEIEDSGQRITFQDLTTGEVKNVVIDKIDFTRSTPPSREFSGAGGILTVILRTL